jgi:hypothetical protein
VNRPACINQTLVSWISGLRYRSSKCYAVAVATPLLVTGQVEKRLRLAAKFSQPLLSDPAPDFHDPRHIEQLYIRSRPPPAVLCQRQRDFRFGDGPGGHVRG